MNRLTARPANPIDWAAHSSEPDPCIVCGCEDITALHAPTFAGAMEDLPHFFLAHRTATAHGPIVSCRTCGFVFTRPRFSSDEYSRIYGAITTPHEGDGAFDQAKRARFRRLEKIVRGYCPPGSRFVDFGCGDGTFLKQLKDGSGTGFEVGDPGRCQIGPSAIVTGRWADVAGSADFPEATFDFVTAFDVLEHLPDLAEDVRRLRSLLKPGGLLFASVPDISSAIARIMGKRWNMLLLEHLWYFSPATLRRFLAQHGFEQVAVKSIPFDAPISHIATRVAQTFGMKETVPVAGIGRILLPAPAGIMLGIYRAI